MLLLQLFLFGALKGLLLSFLMKTQIFAFPTGSLVLGAGLLFSLRSLCAPVMLELEEAIDLTTHTCWLGCPFLRFP